MVLVVWSTPVVVKRTSVNKRVPPALTTFAPENTARDASRVGDPRTLYAMAQKERSGRGWVR